MTRQVRAAWRQFVHVHLIRDVAIGVMGKKFLKNKAHSLSSPKKKNLNYNFNSVQENKNFD